MCVEEEIVLKGMEARDDVGSEKMSEISDMRQILGRKKSMLDARRGYITETEGQINQLLAP